LRLCHKTFNSGLRLLLLLIKQAAPRQKHGQADGGFAEIAARKSLSIRFRHSDSPLKTTDGSTASNFHRPE